MGVWWKGKEKITEEEKKTEKTKGEEEEKKETKEEEEEEEEKERRRMYKRTSRVRLLHAEKRTSALGILSCRHGEMNERTMPLQFLNYTKTG